ncbi:EAL domain-containing protein [Robbsia sp. KACC 23696]|uniref:EAL domain-containing protein n=1 Tax=Robbsia sp. KACC 23696 TaxID=3149231 RepID=UPI00325B1254
MEALQRTSPPLPFNEAERLRAVLDSCILDTPQDPAFDAVVHAASMLVRTPIAGVSLMDQHRQWFKASVGLDESATAREDAFCAYAILQREPLIVPDARGDARFATNRLVVAAPGVCFYAGVPVRSDDGLPLGTLFVADVVPRSDVDAEMIDRLKALAETVEALIRLSRSTHYVDRTSGLPNERRFHENAAALRESVLLAGEGADIDAASDADADGITSPLGWMGQAMASTFGGVAADAQVCGVHWAVCVEAVSSAQADDWVKQGKASRIDQQIEAIATWLRSAAATRDGVYRISARHLAFFLAMPRAGVARVVGGLARDLAPLVGYAADVGNGPLQGGASRESHRFAAQGDALTCETETGEVCVGTSQVVAMDVAACAHVADLVTALMAPRQPMSAPLRRAVPALPRGSERRIGRTALHVAGRPVGRMPGALADAENAPADALREAPFKGLHAVPTAKTAAPDMDDAKPTRLAYDPARDGCQMRVNLSAAFAEGFDVTVPDYGTVGDVVSLRGAGLGDGAAIGRDWRSATAQASSASPVPLDVAQRLSLLDWFSRWWTVERRQTARLQLRGGMALLDQAPRPWLDALLHVGLLPAQLEVAVPLAALREQFSATQRRIRVWREAGIGVVITGFGAGFDTVRWLPNLPLTGVSFDPRVIDTVRDMPKHARVVQRLVSLAHALGMRVSVDGLQSEETLRVARGLGIDEGCGDAAAKVFEMRADAGVARRIGRTVDQTDSTRAANAKGANAMAQCQHGEGCTAGCIPLRSATGDSITRASMYPRFRFQS